MLIKVSGQFLDFNDDIEIERKVKAFEEIESVDGDFSYSFDVQKTSYNLELLGNPLPDTVKSFRKISAEILNESGVSLYNGFLRVERITDVIECSFFSGNSEWFSDLTGDLLDITSIRNIFDNSPRDFDGLGVLGSFDNTSGWFFPFADYGTWSTRSHYTYTIEDFHPWYYLKDLVKKVLSDSNIKLTGDLLNDWRYNHAIITSGIKQDQRLKDNTQETDEDVSVAVSEAGGPETLETYTLADYAVYVRVKATITMTGASADVVRLGLSASSSVSGISQSYEYEYDGEPLSIDYAVTIQAGTTLNLFAEVLNTGGSMTVTHVTATFEPLFIYSFAINEILPDWTKVELMINVFKLFNCIISYEPATKTITANLFDKIKSKTPIDLSEYLHSQSTDLVEFIQNYGQKSKLLYSDGLDSTYNNVNTIPYGGGVIEVDNEYIEQEVDAVEVDFSTPRHGRVRALKGNFEHFEFSSYEEIVSEDITSVTDDSGQARLNMASTANFIENNIVRVFCDNDAYNGDWVVEDVQAGYIKCYGLGFIANTTGTCTALRVVRDDTDDAFICLAVADISALDVSDVDFSIPDIGYCYFNLLRTGKNIDEYKKSMSFGPVNTEGDYQQKLKEDYFNLFGKVLNDPVKLPCEMFLPESVFKSLTFQEPVTLKSIDSSNMYFVNRISGYINSSKPCLVELIKL